MSIIDEMYKIKLIENSKRPVNSSWKDMQTNKPIKGNYGILTGEKNNITVIDVDFYTKDTKKPFSFNDSAFLKKFGLKYIKRFNTLTQKTINGGFHLFFKYDSEIKQTANQEHQIDIRNNGGYVVGHGSTINGNKYIIEHDTNIKPIPNDLKKWLLDNIYTKQELSIEKRKKTIILEDQGEFKYGWNEKMLRNIFDNLDKSYFKDYGTGKIGKRTWLNFTTFCKTVNCYDLWNEYSKKYGGEKYDKLQNDRMWNAVKTDIDCFTKIFKENSIKEYKHYKYYMRYKPLKEYKLDYDYEINREKLGYDFFKEFSGNSVIQSDTGTGKTTSFKHYIKNKKLKFISIVSRISLAEEQYNVFNKYGIDCCIYSDMDEFAQYGKNNNLVITVDSLLRLIDYEDQCINLTEYTIFLDEFNSIIEHLLNSSTLNSKRLYIYDYLIKILKQTKQFICVDADISDISINFINNINKQYDLIKNDYQHNKNVKAYELESFNDLKQRLEKEEKYMVCCDSKNNAIYLYETLNGDKDDDIICITSETEQHINLDKYKKVIFSPKIIYGLDSIMERPVYCYYKTYTINPSHMLQQIARTRKITNLYYFFEKKLLNSCSYKDYDDCIFYNKNIKKLKENYHDRYGINKKIEKQYFDLYCLLDYKNDCYNSNTFLHFTILLKERGFIVQNGLVSLKREDNKKVAVSKYLEGNFDIKSDKVKRLAKTLHLSTQEKIIKYKEVFIDSNLIVEHFSVCNYLYKEIIDLKATFDFKDDFIIKKVKSNINKMIFLKELQEKIGFESKKQFTIQRALTKDENPIYFSKYKLLFRDRSKTPIDLTNKYELLKVVVKIMKSLLGNKTIETEKKQKDKKREQTFNFNHKFLQRIKDFHTDLYYERNVRPSEYGF